MQSLPWPDLESGISRPLRLAGGSGGGCWMDPARPQSHLASSEGTKRSGFGTDGSENNGRAKNQHKQRRRPMKSECGFAV